MKDYIITDRNMVKVNEICTSSLGLWNKVNNKGKGIIFISGLPATFIPFALFPPSLLAHVIC